MSADEIRDMFHLQFEESAKEHELPRLLFAQHYAEINRNPSPDVMARLDEFFGKETARDILLLIRVIFLAIFWATRSTHLLPACRGKKPKAATRCFNSYSG